MRWPQRESNGVAWRCAVVAVCAFVACVFGYHPRPAVAEPLSSTASTSFTDDQRAEELYLDGVEKLAAGHGDFARETFELVLTRFPSTAAAENARRQLSALDEGHAGVGGVEATDEQPVTGSLPSLSEAAEAPDTQPARSFTLWNRELRRNASIQSKLRLEAGDRVFFAPGSAELGSRARTALAAQAQWLVRWREFEAAIEGHSDEPGSEQENIELSQQRAEAVRQRLIEEGVAPTRLAVVPLGRSVRIATCADADCRAQNRRAVTLVFATGTRERLGLVGSAPVATALAPATPTAATPAAATTAQALGVTR